MPRFKVECRLGQSIVDAIDEKDAENWLALEYGRVNGPYSAKEIDQGTTALGMGDMMIHRTDLFLISIRKKRKV